MSLGFNRRDFSKAAVTAAAAGAASTLAPARMLGAGDQVRLGFIGVGKRGCQLLKAFLAHPDANIVALCDVYAPYLNAEYDKVDPRFASLGQRIPRMAELPADVARVKDFRTVLDRPDIDAVVIATPDHRHAIQTIAACKAGKDVYVEKPQIGFSSPRFFRSTGASGKCLSSQRVRPQSTRRGATVLVRTKSFPCQDRVIWRWWRSMARIVARATVSGDIVRRSFTETRAVLTTMFSSKEVSVNPGLT
jgi:hypothetical protein